NLGTGVDAPPVLALAAGRWNGTPAVVAGGDFATAGGKPSGKLALWFTSPGAGSCSPAGRAPQITVTSPTATSQATITVTGRIDEPADLTLNGQTVMVGADLSFSVPGVALAAGHNDLFLEAVDRTGARGSLHVDVVRDAMAPTLAFVSPPAGATVFASPTALDLSFDDGLSGVDPTTLVLQINGATQPPTTCSPAGSRARCVVTVAVGAVTATATVRDRAGNLSAPATLAFQANLGAGASTQLVGTVRRGGAPAAGARVRILGRPGVEGTSQADGSFAITVPAVTVNTSWTVVAELPQAGTSLIGFRSGVIPVPGGTTSVGTIDLGTACDGEFARDLFGIVGVAGRVRAMAVYDDGTGPALYVGGDYLRTDGTTAHHLLVWKGDRLAALPAAPNGPVHSLQVFNEGGGPKLYAGGAFTSAGGVAVRNLARWNGSTWSDVGGGVESCGVSGGVDALAVFDLGQGPRLYVGGDFISVGAGAAADLVAAWDGSAWTGFGPSAGCPGLFSYGRAVFALARYDDGTGPALYAAGEFGGTISGVAAKGIAKRVGSTWAPLSYGLGSVDSGGFPLPSLVTSLAVFDGGTGAELYAAGAFNRAGNLSGTVAGIAR
ncbi:MAG TPA: hypothetical protein VGV61_18795, partial [Thermoanaerobaculia bacterium]|nr:hypothetical protein [Thermoanaerobaculia bacterium]